MPKILLVEDDPKVGKGLQEWLQADRYLVEWVTTGDDALLRLKLGKFDVVILDWELPDISGVEISRQLRSESAHIPILMLTGRSSIGDKTVGFESGADDYLTKPFHPKEVSLRLAALLRRPSEVVTEELKAGELLLDPNNYSVSRHGETIKLMPKEFDLLAFLVRHPGQLFSPESLLERVWPTDSTASTDVVKVYVQKIRAKVDVKGQPSIISTVYGRGYRLNLPAQS